MPSDEMADRATVEPRPHPGSPAADEHPQRIGPYRIVGVLGEGGMGVVYHAEQMEPVRRPVALKILKPGMDTRQVVARFESERQALAVMEHPGIARVFDAGATEAGRPYFAMERVDGVPITEYCDAQQLSLRERVRLFLQVCRAVQHAHQKGVIHRDLKPSNVLVGETDGEPLCKVIDFGIARATESDAEERTRLTQMEQSLGTPAYMSPEQAIGSGLDVDTRTDIYSLGVLLYELLCGVLPFEPRAYRGWAFYAHHMTREPPRPSARFAGLPAAEQARLAGLRRGTPDAVRRGLRGDLDWIVLRAVEKERERRYETANGLALDLERYHSSEPVLATPPSAAYTARKFVRRHRIGVAFAAAMAVLLVAFAASMAIQADRVARARDLAVARQGQAEDLIGFMLGDLRGKLTPVGRLDILDEVGQRALAYFAAVPESELSDQELFRRAEATRHLGEVRLEQGDRAAAMDAFRRALELAQGLAARDPANGEWQLGLAAAHFWVGNTLLQERDHAGALRHFVHYQQIAERLTVREPQNQVFQKELAYASSNIGYVRERQGDLSGARDAFHATLSMKERLAALDPQDADLQLDLAQDYNLVAVVERKLGDLASARANHRREVEVLERLVASDPANMLWIQSLASAHFYLGLVMSMVGELDAAEAHATRAVALSIELTTRDPTNAVWQRLLAGNQRQLGVALLDGGDVRGGIEHLQESRAQLQQLLARDRSSIESGRLLVRTELELVRALREGGQPRLGVSAADRALALLDPMLTSAPENRDLRLLQARAYLLRGEALDDGGQRSAALEAYALAHAGIAPMADANDETEFIAVRARLLLLLGQTSDARPLVDELWRRGYRERGFVSLAERKGGFSPI